MAPESLAQLPEAMLERLMVRRVLYSGPHPQGVRLLDHALAIKHSKGVDEAVRYLEAQNIATEFARFVVTTGRKHPGRSE